MLIVENDRTKLAHTGAVHVAAQGFTALALGLPLTELRIDGADARCVVSNPDDFNNADGFTKREAMIMVAQAGGWGERVCLRYHRLGDSPDLEFIRDAIASADMPEEAARILGRMTRKIVKQNRSCIIKIANALLKSKKVKRDGDVYRVLDAQRVFELVRDGKKRA